MIAEGCIMARICHTNNCPVGVTTQKEELRKKFPGTPQNVVTFFQVQPPLAETRQTGRQRDEMIMNIYSR